MRNKFIMFKEILCSSLRISELYINLLALELDI